MAEPIKGMLWFDNSEQPFHEKIERAVAFYREKYNLKAAQIYLNRKTLPSEFDPKLFPGLELIVSNKVLPNHFLVSGKEIYQRKEVNANE